MVGVDGVDQRDLNRLFELLRSPRRRVVLYHLRDEDGPMAVERLVDVVADWEATNGDPDATESHVDSELRHRHLPKLADFNAIDYDQRSRVVRYTGSPLLESWLDQAEPIDRA